MSGKTGSLEGKVALITGGAHGIGKALATRFAEEGALVAICDLREAEGESTARAIRDRGLVARFFRTDLRLEREIQAAVEGTFEAFHRMDILINNARPPLRILPLGESLAEWDLAMDVLLKAPALLAHHCFPRMVESGGGSVLNMGSTNAFFISHQPVAYHVAKAGLLHLTPYPAHEFAPHGIRVNCICPGLVDLYDDNRPLTGNPLNREVTELAVPLRRASTGADIAEAALFLCADSAACITGEVLTIDGGLGLADHFHLARKMLRSAEGRNSNCDSPGRKG